MPFAVDLQQAGFLGYPQLTLQWIANTLKANVQSFSNAVSPLFEDAVVNDRPIGNWLVLIDALVSQIPAVDVPETQFNQLVEYVGRMCLACFVAFNSGLVSATQNNAMLAAWNTIFGT